MNELTTPRLILRPWAESDAERLYELARDPQVGPAAGWDPHSSVEESLEIIRTVFNGPYTYAVCLRADERPVGCAGLSLGNQANRPLPEDEAEIGYWLGVPYWGQGLIPEAVRALLRLGFEELGLKRIWLAYFDGNEKSRRVSEKCGFRFHHTNAGLFWELTGQTLTEHVTVLEKADWLRQEAE